MSRLSELAVAKHQHLIGGLQVHLFKDLEGRSKRFRENRFVV